MEAEPHSIGSFQYDFQTIVTHELGHAIGLEHSGDRESVMFPMLTTGEVRRSVTDHDLVAVELDHRGNPEGLHAVESNLLSIKGQGYTYVLSDWAFLASKSIPTLIQDRLTENVPNGLATPLSVGALQGNRGVIVPLKMESPIPANPLVKIVCRESRDAELAHDLLFAHFGDSSFSDLMDQSEEMG